MRFPGGKEAAPATPGRRRLEATLGRGGPEILLLSETGPVTVEPKP
jgi:hypothetical protein